MLKPGGTCLLTFFLLTPESEAEIASGTADLAFTHPIEGGATTDPGLPEEAVAFDIEEVTAMLAEAGLDGPRADPPRQLGQRPGRPQLPGHHRRDPVAVIARLASSFAAIPT